MKLKQLLIVAVAMVAAAPAMGQTAGKWTLDDCLNYAMANNISLKKQGLTKQSATEDWKQSRSALLPSLSASTNQSLGWRPWINDGTSTVSNGTVANKISKTYYNGSYGVSASWTVWNGGKNTKTVRYNKMTEEAAELDSATTANSIREQIAQLYIQILYTTEAIAVNKESVDASRKTEERGQVMYEVGKLSKADLAQLTAQRAAEEYTLTASETQLQQYTLQLKQLLELSPAEVFEVYIPEQSDDKALEEIPSLQATYEAALTTRPEIAAAEIAIKSSSTNISIAKAGYYPTIGINGSLGTSTSSMTDKEWGEQMKTNFDAAVGLSLSIPIFDNRSTKTAVRKARLSYEQSLLDLQDQQKTLYSTIEGYWLDATSNQAMFRSATASVESQQASYDLLSEQFELGLKNIVELLTGKTSLLSAQQEKLQSKYMTILDIQLLKFYAEGEIK